MAQSIYLQVGESLVEMKEEPYDSEDLLQSLLERYSHFLAGSQMDEESPRKWLFVCREATMPHEQSSTGRLDHFFLDQDAIPTLVEVKRSTDTRLRREVVGQMLDYGANAVVYWPVDRIRLLFEQTCSKRKQQPEQAIKEVFGSETDIETYWHRVKENLQAGRIRMIFLADEIPSELKRIVEFLNSQMDRAEVLAIEVKRYSGQGQTTYVPRLIGQTSEAESRKRPEGRQWDRLSFFEELTRRKGKQDAEVASKILEWAEPKVTRTYWGKGKSNGSFVPIVRHKETDHQLFAVYTYGVVEIYFQYYKGRFDPWKARKKLLDKLREIRGVTLSETDLEGRPSIPLSLLGDTESLNQFVATFDWFLSELQKG